MTKLTNADEFRTIEAKRVAQQDGFHAAMMERSAVCPFIDVDDVRRAAWITGYTLGLELVDEK